MRHLILYDGECPLCNRAVRVILTYDTKKQFYFSPLQSKKAHLLLQKTPWGKPPFDTLVLLENYGTKRERLWVKGKGSVRIAWHLKGRFFLLGLLSFLPAFLLDPVYRWVTGRRAHLFSKGVTLNPDDYKDRFLS